MATAKRVRLGLILILVSCVFQFCAAEELAARRDFDYVRSFFPSILDHQFPFVQLARDANAIAMANTRVDWLETPESHVFKADLPGLSKQDVKVEIEDGNTLRISAHRKKEKIEDTDKWHRVERVEGSFLRSFRLPEDAQVENIKAEMLNGVLTVTIPKRDQPKRLIQPVEIIDSSSMSPASGSSDSSMSSESGSSDSAKSSDL